MGSLRNSYWGFKLLVCTALLASGCSKISSLTSGGSSASGKDHSLITSPTSISRVNQKAWGGITVANETVSQSLGWTVGSNRFFVLQLGGGNNIGANTTSVTAYAGSTAYPMKMAANMNGSQASSVLYYLPNASGITSVSLTFYETNGSSISLIAAEYSGMSASPTICESSGDC
jgi:uncharacterized protein YceK